MTEQPTMRVATADAVQVATITADLLTRYQVRAVPTRDDSPPYVVWICTTCPNGHVGIVARDLELDQSGLTIAELAEAVLEHDREEHA